MWTKRRQKRAAEEQAAALAQGKWVAESKQRDEECDRERVKEATRLAGLYAEAKKASFQCEKMTLKSKDGRDAAGWVQTAQYWRERANAFRPPVRYGPAAELAWRDEVIRLGVCE